MPFMRIALAQRDMASRSCRLCARMTMPRWLSMMLKFNSADRLSYSFKEKS